MARKLVNREDVYSIADALSAEGVTPSSTSIYKRLGHGSFRPLPATSAPGSSSGQQTSVLTQQRTAFPPASSALHRDSLPSCGRQHAKKQTTHFPSRDGPSRNERQAGARRSSPHKPSLIKPSRLELRQRKRPLRTARNWRACNRHSASSWRVTTALLLSESG